MTTIMTSTSFNVEASLNEWLRAALTAFTRPSWLSVMPGIVQDAPQTTAAMPCFSFLHIPVATLTNSYQGRNVGGGLKGGKSIGMMDVSCWVSRSKSPHYAAQLRTMADMVQSAAMSQTAVVVMDYASSQTAPSSAGYKVDIGDITETQTQPDPNPDVERVRILIDYSFTFRAN